MTVTWVPRIDVKLRDEIVGWLVLDPVVTEVLPRIGEVVSLFKVLPKELPLNSDLSYQPRVVRIEHYISPGDNEVRVIVEVKLGGNLDNFAAVAKENGLTWLAKN